MSAAKHLRVKRLSSRGFRASLVAAVIATCALLPDGPAVASNTPSQTSRYTASFFEVVNTGCKLPEQNPHVGIGGACFLVRNEQGALPRNLQVSVTDVTGAVVPFELQFVGSPHGVLQTLYYLDYCGSTRNSLAPYISPYTQEIWVVVTQDLWYLGPGNSAPCTGPGYSGRIDLWTDY